MTVPKKSTLGSPTLPEGVQKLLRRLEGRPVEDILNSEALRIVRAIWPVAFSVIAPKPLKIHVHKDMESAELIPPFIIHKALKFYTAQDRYLKALKPGTIRINLQGEQGGTVRLREAVDAEIRRYHLSYPQEVQRERVVIKQIRLMSVKKAS